MNSQIPETIGKMQGIIRRSIAGTVAVVAVSMALMNLNVKAENSENAPLRQLPNDEKKIALTFDDGPDERYTPEILDVLTKYNVKATFFVIGVNCEMYPDIMLREIREGHEIGNHTYSHPRLTNISAEKLINEIIGTENALFEICEYRPKLFRPPEGVYSETVKTILKRLDYIPVTWSVDTLDWRGSSEDSIVKAALNHPKSGMIILCHDYISYNGYTSRALDKFIPELQKMGYEFVTVSELIISNAKSGAKVCHDDTEGRSTP